MIGQVFALLYQAYGEQNWWPADTKFEMMMGAILMENSNGSDVEKAIVELKKNDALTPETVLAATDEQLATWIHSSGFYNVKAERLKTYAQWYLDQGGFETLNTIETEDLKNALLAINGIGHETTDAILLYAFERPVFVVDEDTRRLFYRLALIQGSEAYEDLQHLLEIMLDRDAGLFNEYHALIVRHAKEHCREEPLCEGCPLDSVCPE